MHHHVIIVTDAQNKLLHSTISSLTPAANPNGEWREYSSITTNCGQSITAPTAGLTWRGHLKDITCPECASVSRIMTARPYPPRQRPSDAESAHMYGRNSRTKNKNTITTVLGLKH